MESGGLPPPFAECGLAQFEMPAIALIWSAEMIIIGTAPRGGLVFGIEFKWLNSLTLSSR